MVEQDLLHPSTTVHWEEYFGRVSERGVISSECVLWNKKLCVGIVDRENFGYDGDWTTAQLYPKLLVFSPDCNWWKTIHTVPISYFALTTYCSKLVLVGGKETELTITNKLWVSEDGSHWQPSLPPMPTKRFSSVAVNVGSPGHLVVVGGMLDYGTPLDTVEVLQGEQWSTLQPLPLKYVDIRHTVHNGNLFLVGRHHQHLRHFPVSCEHSDRW